MAAITPANVAPGAGATFIDGIAGGALPDGAAVYLDTATNTYKLCDADVLATSLCAGITTHDAATGQPIRVQNGGDMTLGTMTLAVAYYVGTGAGEIVPVADIGSGDFVSLIGIAISTTVIRIRILNSGVALG